MKYRWAALVGAFLLILASMAVAVGGHTEAASLAGSHKTVKAVNGNNGLAFTPRKLTIKVGTKVTFKDTSGIGHTVTSNKSGQFDKPLPADGSVSITFKKAGTFKYHCSFHPGMVGTIVVKK
jgi:plastocyanin